MIPVIVESPYAAKTPEERTRNDDYLDECCRWLVEHGFAPYASHGSNLVRILDDNDPAQRELGLAAGAAITDALMRSASVDYPVLVVVCDLHGITPGMQRTIDRHGRWCATLGELMYAADQWPGMSARFLVGCALGYVEERGAL